MPELPEVETTKRGIAPYLLDQVVVQVVVRNPSLRWPIPMDLPTILAGQSIQTVLRRAKYLLLGFESGTLILHLGMSGSLRIQSTELPQKHDHFDLVLNSGKILRLRDPRRFGAVLWYTGNIHVHPLLVHLGVEPLTEAFNAESFYRETRGKRASIKETLMNNKIVVGVGNIYANEALFQAGVNPKITAGRISLVRYEKLVQAVKEILQKAIEAGGSSLRDFVNSNGEPGYFQQQYWVYGRSGKDCRKCNGLIKQFKQGQRSSFYCSHCQR